MFLVALLMGAVTTQAQVRYLNEVFADVQVDTGITYGQNYEFFSGFATLKPLVMDVYRPVGDTATNRPVIFFHTTALSYPKLLHMP